MRGLLYLYKLAEAYIVYTQYYDPDELDKKMIAWPDVKSQEGSALTRFNAKNDVCTFYSVNYTALKLLSSAFNFSQCLSGYRFGRQNEKRHGDWHNTPSEFSKKHMHLVKSHITASLEEKIDLVTPQELSCLFESLKKFEKEHNLCLGTPETCLVTDADSDVILKRYTAFYKEKLILNREIEAKLQEATQRFYADLETKCLNGGKSFAHAFAGTLLDKYLQPYLLTQGIACSHAITEGLRSTLTLLMTQSLVSTMTEFMIRNGLKPVLMQLGLNLYMVERVLSGLGTAVAFAQNPLSLVDLGLNGAAAITGENLAYNIIHKLPKLKFEPEDKSVHEETIAVREQSAGLRRRKVGN